MAPRDAALAALVAATWGLNFLVARWGLTDLPPLLLGALRLGGLALLAPLLPRPRLPLRTLIVFGSVWGTLQLGGLFVALALGVPSGVASVLLQAQVIFTALLSMALGLEAPAPHHALTVVLAGTGLAVVVGAQGAPVPLIGVLAALVAAVGWALSNVMLRRLALDGIAVGSPGFLAWTSIVPALSLLALSLLVNGPDAVAAGFARASWRTAATVAYLTIGASLWGTTVWNRLLRRYPASAVSPFALLVPVVAMLAARWVLGERATGGQWLGGALLLGSVAVSPLWERLRRWLEERPLPVSVPG